MSAPLHEEEAIDGRLLVVAAGAVLLAALAAGAWPGAAAGLAAAAAGPLAFLRTRHRVRVDQGRLLVGRPWAGGFDVPLDASVTWAVLPRRRTMELRLAMTAGLRVACLPWRPAAAWLVTDSGAYLVGTGEPDRLRAVLAAACPLGETAEPPLPRPLEGVGAPAGSASVEGAPAVLLLGVATVFGATIPLLAVEVTSGLPAAAVVAGGATGLVAGALVVVEVADRTPIGTFAGTALAAVAAGATLPVAAAVAGAPMASALLLALVTVPVAFMAASLRRPSAR